AVRQPGDVGAPADVLNLAFTLVGIPGEDGFAVADALGVRSAECGPVLAFGVHERSECKPDRAQPGINGNGSCEQSEKKSLHIYSTSRTQRNPIPTSEVPSA